MLQTAEDTYIPQREHLAGSLVLALARQEECRQGGVVRVEGGQLVTVYGGRRVGPQGARSRQRRPHAAAQAVGLALSPLILNR